MPLPTLTATAPTRFDTSYGGIPAVPDPTASAGAAITGNISNLADLYKLGGGINQFQIGQAQQPLISGLPNYQNMIAQSSKNIGSLLAGEIPEDVKSALYQAGAERGVATGGVGSANANAALLRAMGLTSLDLTGRGESELTAAIGRTPQPKLFDPTAYLTTPEQMQEAGTAANIYAAAPTPADAASAAMAAARAGSAAGTRLAGGGGIGYGSRVSGMSPITQTPNLGANLGGPGEVVMGAGGVPNPTNTWASRTGSDIGSAWNSWAQSLPGAENAYTGERIDPNSAAWRDLQALDPMMTGDTSGWSRADLAAVLGKNPQDIDIGTPAADSGYFYAGANPELPGGGGATWEDYFDEYG